MPRAVTGARFAGIAVLCAPSILATLGFCLMQANTLANTFLVWEIVLALFMGATYGPLLLPAAAVLLVTANKTEEPTSTTRLAWGTLALGSVATGVFHLYLIHVLDLP